MMLLRTGLITLFFLVCSHLYGQRALKKSTEDFNQDGFIDTLISYYEGGSGFGGRTVKIINGKNQEQYEMNNDGCFCEIYRIVVVPPVLQMPKNEAFLKGIKKYLLPEKRVVPDASLEYLIKSTISNTVLEDHKIFDLIIDPGLSWKKIPFEYPQTYYLELGADTLEHFFNPLDLPKWYSAEKSKGFLIYYGHNHYRNPSGDSLTLAVSNAEFRIYRTSHGVLAKKEDWYKWLFLSDVNLTGAPGKLRWESIGRMKLIDQYLILEQNFPVLNEFNLYIINIESGLIGRLKYDIWKLEDYFEKDWEVVSTRADRIILRRENKLEALPLELVFKALDKQKRTD